MTKEGGLLDSGADTEKLADGRYASLDTPRMWQSWTLSVDSEVPRELAYRNRTAERDPLRGSPQGGGTWDEYWLSRIQAVSEQGRQRRQEHAQKYINYIIDQRRKAGLPELIEK